jgi:hypothetical protein
MNPREFNNYMNFIINELKLTKINANLMKSNKGPNRVRKQLFKKNNNNERKDVAAK